MTDLLVKLYDLPDTKSTLKNSAYEGICYRRAMAYEKHQVVNWVCEHFSMGWASECDVAFSNQPSSCHIVTKDGAILGFACYDPPVVACLAPFVFWNPRAGGASDAACCILVYTL